MDQENIDGELGFVERFLDVQNSVFAFLRSRGLDVNEAEDALQDVARELWRNYRSYDHERPFVAWAIGIARNVARSRFRRKKVRKRVIADTDLTERIAERVAGFVTDPEQLFADEKAYLEECLAELPDHSLQLVRLRYYLRLPLSKVAQHVKRSYGSTNVALSRIRRFLMDCITRNIARNTA